MLFSCKISSSLLTHLDRKGENLQLIEEMSDLPPLEFLKDPSYWIEAPKMEALLRFFQDTYGLKDAGSIVTEAGHRSKDLRSWGALDSVLRMVQNPKDIYAQPAKLISYFISPAPPIGVLQKDDDAVSFDLPIAASQYPLSSEYVRAALESLPTYSGKSQASVKWDETRIHIHWQDSQKSFLEGDDEVKPTLHPELLQTIVTDLEHAQKQLEETNRVLHVKEQELRELRAQVAQSPQIRVRVETPETLVLGEPKRAQASLLDLVGAEAATLKPGATTVLGDVLQDVYKLGDYLGRAQQLVTLLVAQDRLSPQVQEAMRRVDWPRVQNDTRRLVAEAAIKLKELQSKSEA
jgi:hypothetical protein